MVGETAEGDPIVEVRSVRLVLQGDANYFHRMLSCSKCGRDAPGPPVLGPTDLNRQVDAVVCKDCVRGATSTASSGGQRTVAERRTSKVVPSRVVPTRPDPPASAPDPRLAALERQIAELLAESKEVDQRMEAALARRLAPLEADRAQLRAGVVWVARRHEELGRAQEDLMRRLTDAVTASTLRLEGLEARLQGDEEAEPARVSLEPALREQVAAGLVRLEEQLAQGLAAAAEAEAARRRELELRIHEAIEGRTAAIEAQQSELRAALESSVQQLSTALERYAQGAGEAVARVSSDNVGLRGSQAELTSTLQRVLKRVEQLQDAEPSGAEPAVLARVEEQLERRLASASENESERLRALERQVMQAVEGRTVELRTAFESQVQQLRAAPERSTAEAGTADAAVELTGDDVRRAQEALSHGLEGVLQRVEQLNHRLDDLADRSSSATAAESERLLALEQRLQRAVEARTGDIEAAQVELRTALDSNVQELRTALERHADAGAGDVRRSQAELAGTVHDVLERVESLHETVDAEAAQARSATSTAERANVELEMLKEQLDGLANRFATAAEMEADRLQAAERVQAQYVELRAALTVLEQQGVEATGDDVRRSQEALSHGLEGVLQRVEQLNHRLDDLADRSSSAAAAESERLLALEQRLQRAVEARTGDIEAQQVELRAALDSNVQELRTALERYADEAVARAGAGAADVRRSQAELAGTVHDVLEQVESLQETVAGQARSATSTSERANVELEVLKEQVDGLADRFATAAEKEADRVQVAERIHAQQIELRADLDASVERLRTALDQQAEEARSAEDVRRSQESLSRRLEDVFERMQRVEATAGEEAARRRTIEERLGALSEQTSTAMELHSQHLQAVREGVEDRTRALENNQTELRAALEPSVEELRHALEAAAVRADSESAARERLERRWMRNDDLLNERLARLAGAAEVGNHRLEAMEAAVEDLPARFEAGQAELGATLGSTVEQLAASVQHQVDQVRLEFERVTRDVDSVRAQLQQLTTDLQEVSAQPDAQSGATADRAPEVVEWELESVRREVKEELGLMPEALESLRRELQTAFSEAMAMLRSSSEERAAEDSARIKALETAVAERNKDVSELFEMQTALDTGMGRLASDLAAVRGLSNGSSLGPLRSDVKALQKQIAAQNQALVAVKKSIDTLRRGDPNGSTLAVRRGAPKAK